jgi:hypothetical protein
MLDLPFVLDTAAPASALILRLEGGAGTFAFDHAEYDEHTDRLRLEAGPPTASGASLTPEGHVLRIGAPEGHLCGLVLTDVRRRLMRHGHVKVTLGAGQHVSLGAGELAHLLTARARPTGRFRRPAA